jgi:hypothetical protein
LEVAEMTLADKANRLVRESEKEGASQAEAFVILAKTSSVYIDDDIPKIVDAKEETGVGLKFILENQIGFTSSTLLSESVEDVVRRAKSMAKMSSADPKFRSLPDPKNPTVPFQTVFCGPALLSFMYRIHWEWTPDPSSRWSSASSLQRLETPNQLEKAFKDAGLENYIT